MQSSSNELDVLVGELQKKFERLKVLYEQYFMGIERMEPLVPRKELTRAILQLQQTYVRNTGTRFRVATLIQKWNIYQAYWNRTIREIDAGRYVRHVAAAKRHAERDGVALPVEEMGLGLLKAKFASDPQAALSDSPDEGPSAPLRSAPDEREDFVRPEPVEGRDSAVSAAMPETDTDKVAAVSTPPAPEGRAARPKPPPPAEARPPAAAEGRVQVPGMSDDQVRALHQRVVGLQRSLGGNAEMRFETLVAQLSRQVPRLLQEHRCAGVEFDVIVRDGKVKLKPTPK